ncbi:MAG: hypothetical protein ABIQ59_17190 [Nocardioidaceae bacterium]
MRVAAVLLVLGLSAAGCSHEAAGTGTPTGCDMVPASKVVGLVGTDLDTTATGSLKALRAKHSKAVCRSVVPGHPERSVTIVAEQHPKPFNLPAKSCAEGWVYAGTPEKYTPACQETIDGHGVTTLIVRWQPYLMHVTIGRSDKDWGGDPERALSMSRIVAQRLGVKEAAGDG